ncbi:hypothetical protein QQS21_005136 [Conoideocrella luteorostrata]|uniref:TNT domain-containing protein n=1 Tax=Conoideocrella luteorostrata TaxID=1105319 RepID=A0AAJ0FZ99_9HYPO|nr:hypothetical protein QQS21_005136 [Conoideocrella luteorostrata]
MQVSLVLLTWILGFAEFPLAAALQPPWHAVARDTEVPAECKGTKYSKADAETFLCGDWRLGPKNAPIKGYEYKVLRCILNGYDRLGGMTAGGLISNFTINENGYWRYPSGDGFTFKTDGKTKDTNTIQLKKDEYVDRFGSEKGFFLAPAGTLYKERSIPPSNLNIQSATGKKEQNFYAYRVNEPFTVNAGNIAPWFGQPGGGEQYHTEPSGNIKQLVKTGKLVEVTAKEIWDSGKMKCPSDEVEIVKVPEPEGPAAPILLPHGGLGR